MFIVLIVLLAALVLLLVLIVLHGLVRPASAAGLWLRTLALLLLCALLVLAGMWIFPPWWTPYVLVLLTVLATFNARRRWAERVAPAGPARRWGEIALAGLVGLASIAGLWATMQARLVPPDAVDIAFPLEPGRYLVVNGGHGALINPHFMTLDDPQYADWRGQSFAVDLIAVDRFGWRAENPLGDTDPATYHIFGAQVLAPCDGAVVGAEGDMIDHRVPERDTERLAGNHLLIDCGEFIVLLAHLRQGSLRVGEGDTVATGEPLAEVGNSGQSGEPHLHVHAQRGFDPEAPLSGEPLPITFDGRFLVRNDILTGG
jgi:hypothetical protein